MRVVMVAEQLRRPAAGGIGTYIRGLADGLRSLGDGAPDVVLWASRPPTGRPDPVAGLGRVATSPLPGRALVQAWDRGLSRPSGAPDVVHATSLVVPPAGRAPMSVMVHDLAWRRLPDAFPPRGRRWHEAALGRAIDRAALLMAPSTATAEELVTAGADPATVAVVEEGCDHLPPADHDAADAVLARLNSTADCSGGFMLTVSTIEPRKNLARLVEAYTAARDSLPDPLPLVVVGPIGWGPALDPAPGVVTTGAVDSAVLSSLYERARLVAYVPLWEGFGLPAVEAMRAGTPVVATPMPSTAGPDGQPPAAYEVDPLDVRSIADGLVTVATDDGVRAVLVEAGSRRAGDLTWKKSAQRHVELWTSLMGADGRR